MECADRPQRGCSFGTSKALRFAADLGLFAAAADDSANSLEALGALCPTGGTIGLLVTGDRPAPPGLTLHRGAVCHQMIAERPTPPAAPSFEVRDIGNHDALEILALATLVQPGPFFERTTSSATSWA